MAAARYWRIVGVQTVAGGDLELSELQWFDGPLRIDAGAAIASSHAPASGTLASLQDGSLATACRFNGADIRTPGFYLLWDFGSAQKVNSLRIATVELSRSLLRCTLQYSTDAIAWQGAVPIQDVISPTTGVLGDAVVWRQFPASMNPDDMGTGSSISGDVVSGQYNGYSLRGYAAEGASCQFEVSAISHYYVAVGVGTSAAALWEEPGGNLNSWGFWLATGEKRYGGRGSNPTGAVSTASVVGVVVRNGNFEIYVNGVSRGTLFSGLPEDVKPMICLYATSGGWSAKVNLGRTAFLYPISGATAWAGVEYGLAAPRIVAPSADSAVQIAARAPVPTHSTPLTPRLQLARDVEHGGLGRVYGTVKEKNLPANTPLRRRVFLVDQRSRLVVRETWSDAATGDFEFQFVKDGIKWFVYSLDHEGHYASTSADNQEAERMVLP